MAYVTVDALVVPKWTPSSNGNIQQYGSSHNLSSYLSTATDNNMSNNNSNDLYIRRPSDSGETCTSDFSYVDNSKFLPIHKLREKFEHWLILTYGDVKGRSLFQRILFLDEFFDPKNMKPRKLITREEVFTSLERFLSTLLKSEVMKYNANKKLITDYPYIEGYDEQIGQLIPLLREHVALNRFIKEQQQLLLNEYVNILENYNDNIKEDITKTEQRNEEPLLFNYNNVQLITNMFVTIISNYFAIFQQVSKCTNKWMNENLSSCPNYLIENIKKRVNKCNKYQKESKLLKDDDFNLNNLIEKDFEIGNFLFEYTSDWELHTKDLNLNFNSWKTKMNCTSIEDMKIQKIIGYLNCSLEDCVKTITTNSFLKAADETIETSSLSGYKPIDTSNSLQKFATCIQTSVHNYGSLFRKRSVENVTTMKCHLIGNELYSATQLYKTCCQTSKVKNDEVCYGVRTFIKIDDKRTMYIDLRLNNTKGMLNKFMSLAANKIATTCHESFERIIEEKRKEGFPKPNDEQDYLWLSLKNYCQTYYRNVKIV
ncbi:hypothetical protein ABK040_004443 [Willaertia magna]